MGNPFSMMYLAEGRHPIKHVKYEVKPLFPYDRLSDVHKKAEQIMWKIVVIGPKNYILVVQIPKDKETKLDWHWFYDQASEHLEIDIDRFVNKPSGIYLAPFEYSKEMRVVYIEYI